MPELDELALTAGAPLSVRVCGLELAEGRLTTVESTYRWGSQANLNGTDVCPIHDYGWPYPGDRATGLCLVTYQAVPDA